MPKKLMRKSMDTKSQRNFLVLMPSLCASEPLCLIFLKTMRHTEESANQVIGLVTVNDF